MNTRTKGNQANINAGVRAADQQWDWAHVLDELHLWRVLVLGMALSFLN